MEDALAYPFATVDKNIVDSQRKQRLQLGFANETETTSSCSGFMCWEDVVRWHLDALELRLGMPMPTIRSSRACDIDGLAHRAMQGRTVMRPEVMLNDIMGRISSDAKGRLEALAMSEELESEELVK